MCDRDLVAIIHCDLYSAGITLSLTGHAMRRLCAGKIGSRAVQLLRNLRKQLCASTPTPSLHQARVGLGLMQLEQRRVLAAPVAIDDVYLFDPTVSSSVSVPFDTGVLANDSDADNDPLDALLIDPPLEGQLFFNSDGSFDYIPGPGYTGFDYFTYVAADADDVSNLAFVSIETSTGPSNPPPSPGGGPTTPSSPTSNIFVDTFEDVPVSVSGLAIGPFGSSPGVEFLVQLSVDSGTTLDGGFLSFGTLNGLTILDGADGTGFIEFSGSESDINNALDSLVFAPGLDFSGIDHIRFQYQSQTAAFPASGTTDVDIEIEAVADEPILLVPQQIVYIDPGAPFPIDIDAFSFDIDGSEDVFIVISGVPEELELSLGFERPNEPGAFELRDDEWLFLDAIVQPGGPETFEVTITAIAVEQGNNDFAIASEIVDIVRLPPDAIPPDPFDEGNFDDFNPLPPAHGFGEFDEFGGFDPFGDFGELDIFDPFGALGDPSNLDLFVNLGGFGPLNGFGFVDDLDLYLDSDDLDAPLLPPPIADIGGTIGSGGPTAANRPSIGRGSSRSNSSQQSSPAQQAANVGKRAPSQNGGQSAATQSLGLVSNLKPDEVGRRLDSLRRPHNHRGHHLIAGVTSEISREDIAMNRSTETGLYARALNALGESLEDVRLPDQLADDYSRFLNFLRELPNGDYVVYVRQPGQSLDQAAQTHRLLEVRVVNGRLNPSADEFRPAGELSQDVGSRRVLESEIQSPAGKPESPAEAEPLPASDSAESNSLNQPVSGLIGLGVASQLARYTRTRGSQQDCKYENYHQERSWRGRKARRRTHDSETT